MKRTLIAIAVALVAASGANAATMSIDTDKSTYNVGELITITATLTIAAAGDVADSAAGTAISLEASWDPTTGFVANGAPAPSPVVPTCRRSVAVRPGSVARPMAACRRARVRETPAS
jgi:hypothetical protein